MKSFVQVRDNSDFSIYNLSYCVFSTKENVNLFLFFSDVKNLSKSNFMFHFSQTNA